MFRNKITGAEPPVKRVKLDHKRELKISSADEIRKALRTQDQASLTEGTRVILSHSVPFLTRPRSFNDFTESTCCKTE